MADNLSIGLLILNASLVVQIVMGLLLLASIISWVMILQRRSTYSRAKKLFLSFEERFWSGVDLGQLYRDVTSNPSTNSGAENIFRAGIKEFTRLNQQPNIDADAVMEGVERAMRVALSREEDKLEQHLTFLATVGSTSPYVGLFGTVWGIMNAFLGLANVQQATLASVAPGIAEALIATAIGLFAAIPAVIAYNRYASRVDWFVGNYENFAEELSSILHRRAHAG